MTGGILDHQCLAIAGATCRRRLDLALAIQIGGGKGARFKHLRRSSLEHHFPTLLAGSGTDVHHIVGLGHDIFVMLHHDDRVAIVAELLEAIDEAIIVALVKSDRGLVEDVKHIDQLRTDLRSQSDALALAATQRRTVAIERQIIQSHIDQKS